MIHKLLRLPACLLVSVLISVPSAYAEWVWSPEQGKFVSPKDDTRDNSSQQFDYAIELYKQKQYDKAAEELEELIKNTPAARIAPEAQYRLGKIYEEKGDYYKALKAYQKMIEIYPQNDRFEEVIEREFKLGHLFMSGKKGKFYGIEIRPALPIAIQAFEHITKYAPYGPLGDQAQFNLATAQKKAGQFDAAMQSFQDVIDNYPQSQLIEQSRFELAETSYYRSIAQARDERALEKASEQVQGFIERYPGAPGTEKAAKIREEIDEKNAEKNFKIGKYYEKENFIQSALIYYRDVAKRYPHTQWGAKAESRLRALNQPVEFLATERDKLDSEYDDTKKRLAALGDVPDMAEKQALQRKLERLDKRRKSLEKEKGESVGRLELDLKRREAELKQKFKNLDLKIKKHKDNQSEDFKRAIEKWRASLEAEKDALQAEREQLKGWRSELGVKPFYDGLIPAFMGEPKTPLQKIQAIDAKDLYRISEKKKKTLDEKETLYKQHYEVSAQSLLASGTSSQPAGTPSQAAENNELKAEVAQRLGQYQSRFSTDDWLRKIQYDLGLGSPVAINPFTSSALPSKNPQELLELRLHLREQVAATQNVVETLSTAFDEELAVTEQEKLAEKLETADQTDPQELRKEVKKVEKDIRARYEDIEERDKRKKQLLEDLDRLVGSKAEKTVRQKMTEPLLLPVKISRVFLFGRDNTARDLTRKAEESESADAQELKKQIETEGLMIQAQHQEILQLEQNLEVLRAQASLAGGYQFRSSLVAIPYVFIEDAIDNAEKLITPDERQDLLIEKLGQKTGELEALKRELAQVEDAVKQLPATDQPNESVPATTSSAATEADRAQMRTEIEKLAQPVLVSLKTSPAQNPNADPKAVKELREIEKSLVGVIDDQIKWEDAEKKILEKRMSESDLMLQKAASKSERADLINERERMDARLTELNTQRQFLETEKSRFNKL